MHIWSLGYWQYEMEKSAFKVSGLSLHQGPTGSEIIRFWSKTFTVHVKHILIIIILQKSQNCKNSSIFSHISVWSLAQKRLILIEWITYRPDITHLMDQAKLITTHNLHVYILISENYISSHKYLGWICLL